MDSKGPRLALASKKRKATPLYPGGKEGRGVTAAALTGGDSAEGGTWVSLTQVCLYSWLLV